MSKFTFWGLLSDFVLAGFVCVSGNCMAQQLDEQGYTLTYGKCLDSSEGITAKLLDCMDNELQVQDKLLNAAYQDARQNLSEPQRQILKEAQRAFLKMRDEDTRLIGELTGGSIDRLNAAETMLSHTVQRVRFLLSLSRSF